MKWDIVLDGNFELTLKKVIAFLERVLGDIFGFIADEEGWTEDEAAE